MNQEANQNKKKPGMNKKNRTLIILAGALLAVLILLVVLAVWILPANAPQPTEPTEPAPVVTEPPVTDAPTTEPPTTEPTTEPITEPTEPEIPEKLKELREDYPEAVGWIEIGGTQLDNPVMYAPDEHWKYVYNDIDGEYSRAGSLYIDERSSIDPRSDVLLIHGHNMRNGTMFGSIPPYRSKSHWEEHPTITLSTIKEGIREYEIFAACYERIYSEDYTGFKYYEFFNAESEEEFNEAIEYFKNKSQYETGITPKYGDDLIILNTCSYHTSNGRFIVLARAIEETPETAE